VEITIGKTAGFCSGVRRAIQGVTDILNENEKIYCLGEIIHNRKVVERLIKSGMVVSDTLSSIPDGSKFIIRTHGLQDDNIKQAQKKNLEISDFTCPRVKNTHHLVLRLTNEGYFIYIIGDPGHPEVKAITSLTRGNSAVIGKIQDFLREERTNKAAVVVQTTFHPLLFLDIVKEIITRTKETLVYNTLCEETIKRQKEAKALAEKVDFMLVIGGKNSSNTKTLFAIVEDRVPSVHIEGAQELKESWFENVKRVGIISGASTPHEEVKKVYDALRSFSG